VRHVTLVEIVTYAHHTLTSRTALTARTRVNTQSLRLVHLQKLQSLRHHHSTSGRQLGGGATACQPIAAWGL
jgi:hypothetical protein